MKLHLIVTIAAIAVLGACSAPKEPVAVDEPPREPAQPIAKETPAAKPVYKYTERYFIEKAAIAADTDFDDPLQAIRVIQIKDGVNQVLVVTSFDQVKENGKDIGMESWLAIEMPAFAIGTYDISNALATKFYRFELGNRGKRYDGTLFSGSIEIIELTPQEITGFLNITISGVIKGFDQPKNDFKMSFSGSFRIDKVDIEATKMGKR